MLQKEKAEIAITKSLYQSMDGTDAKGVAGAEEGPVALIDVQEVLSWNGFDIGQR